MKKVFKDKIVNIEKTDLFDNQFLFDYLDINNSEVEIFNMADLLEEKKNIEILDMVDAKPAMYSNVYSSKDELDIFEELFNYAITNNKKIHIKGVTLDEEIKMLEKYYTDLGFLREDINCFDPDFKIPLVTVSVNIENIIWKGSDYKSQKSKIFFNPPIREAGQVKAMYKGINRGVIAGINIKEFNSEMKEFLGLCVREEKILPMTLSKVLNYNMLDIGFSGNKKELIISY